MNNHDQSSSSAKSSRLTRRNLAAASAVLAVGLATRAGQAKALGWPWGGDDPRHDGDKGGSSGGANCFVSGTHILTPNGEVEIDTLKVGDLVITQSGAQRPIADISSTTLTRPANGKWRSDELPVRVQRNAFGPNAPHTDLYLSQAHAVMLDGMLYPVGDLLNGSTIALVDGSDLDTVVLFHIETETHDVIIAEGAACETLRATEATVAIAPIVSQSGAMGSRFKSHLRSALSPVVDLRNDADRMRDRLEDRAELLKAA